jgi:hypothetical protein
MHWMFDGIFALLLLIAIGAGIFWAGFRMGYRHRDNLSLERQKKYRHSRPREASPVQAPSPAESPGDGRR